MSGNAKKIKYSQIDLVLCNCGAVTITAEDWKIHKKTCRCRATERIDKKDVPKAAIKELAKLKEYDVQFNL